PRSQDPRPGELGIKTVPLAPHQQSKVLGSAERLPGRAHGRRRVTMAHRLQRRYLLRVRCGSGLAALISIVWLSACGQDDPASGSAPDGAAGTSNLDSGSAPDAQADVAIDVGEQE